jgi:hypothetical protein
MANASAGAFEHQRLRSHPTVTQTACHATAQGCPYDSLNVGLAQDPDNLNRGADPNPGYVYRNTQTAANYCDNGGAGTGDIQVRLAQHDLVLGVSSSAGPWYIPAIKFTAV